MQLAEDARRFTLTRSELRSGIDTCTYVTWAIVPTAAAVLQSDPGSGDWREAMSGAVAGTVAMVPEGLVLLTSLAFAVAVVRLAQRKVLVQELPAVEVSLASTCSASTRPAPSLRGSSRYRRSSRSTATRPASRRCSPLWPLRILAQRHDERDRGALHRALGMAGHRWSAVLVVAEVERLGVRGKGAWFLGAPDVMLTAVDGADELRDRVRVLADQGHRCCSWPTHNA